MVRSMYREMLPLSEKIKRNYLSLAKQETIHNLRNKNTRETLQALARIYALSGNIGKAQLMSAIYGFHEDTVDLVNELRLDILNQAKSKGMIDNPFQSGTYAELRNYPVYGNLKMFAGYQLALLGDWNGAKSYFNEAIKNGVSPQLNDYLAYYNARAKIIVGDQREAKSGLAQMKRLLKSTYIPIRKRAVLNLLENELIKGRINNALSCLNLLLSLEKDAKLNSSWITSKAYIELGEYYKKIGKIDFACKYFLQALSSNAKNTTRIAVKNLIDSLSEITPKLSSELIDLPMEYFLRLSEQIANEDVEFKRKSLETLKKLITTEGIDERFRLLLIAIATGVSTPQMNEASISELVNQAKSIAEKNRSGLAEEALQLISLNYANFLEKMGDWQKAKVELSKAIQLEGRYTNTLRYKLYQLLKEREPFSSQNKQIQLLRDNLLKGGTDTVQSAEELIPLLIYSSDMKTANWAISKVEEKEPSVSNYWKEFLAGISKAEDRNISTISYNVQKLSYYELCPLGKLGWKNLEPLYTNDSFLFSKELEEEYLLSLFMTDFVIEMEELNTNTASDSIIPAMYAYNLDQTAEIPISRWKVLLMLEQGLHTRMDRRLVWLVLKIAFPTPYKEIVEEASARYKISKALIYALIAKESNFNPKAVSSAQAVGLMQILPSTAKLYETKIPQHLHLRPLTDPEKNIHIGCAYIAEQLRMFGEEYLAIAAYNAGPGNLRNWLRNINSNYPQIVVELLPNFETKQFVKKVLKYRKVYDFILANDF